jgi:hypothetical protein
MDPELLELAAKAAGIEGRYFDSDNPIHRGIYQARGEYWNPLISDSEAFRLAVKLEIEVYQGDDEGPCAFAGYCGRTQRQRFVIEPHGDDACAATRRAIVRAAAELGKT